MVRRIVIWTAGVMLVVSVAGWVVSLACVQWRDAPGPWNYLALLQGELIVAELPLTAGWRVDGFQPPIWRWPPGNRFLGFYLDFETIIGGAPRYWEVVVPLWIPAFVATLAFAPAGLVERGHRRWQQLRRAGKCPLCRYDLSGIAGPCPECGQEGGA